VTVETIATIIAAGLTLIGSFAWWAIQRAMKIGEWKADREHSERLAKNQTRDAITRLEPLVQEVLTETKEQSKTLAVLVYQGAEHGKRLDAVESRLDEHGNRISVLESTDKGGA
jgi:hypothetical protein